MAILDVTPAVAAARAKWQYRGQARPPFAEATDPGEISVWDLPRPPRLEQVASELKVLHGDIVVAQTSAGMRVVETAGAPTYYFPPETVDEGLLIELAGLTLCEWKGGATSFAIRDGVDHRAVAWSYRETFAEFIEIRDWYAFYPHALGCYVGSEQAGAQPGEYYGGWVTADLKGPIKGGAGTDGW